MHKNGIMLELAGNFGGTLNAFYRYLRRIQSSPLRWLIATICALAVVFLLARNFRNGFIPWNQLALIVLCFLNVVIRLSKVPRDV